MIVCQSMGHLRSHGDMQKTTRQFAAVCRSWWDCGKVERTLADRFFLLMGWFQSMFQCGILEKDQWMTCHRYCHTVFPLFPAAMEFAGSRSGFFLLCCIRDAETVQVLFWSLSVPKILKEEAVQLASGGNSPAKRPQDNLCVPYYDWVRKPEWVFFELEVEGDMFHQEFKHRRNNNYPAANRRRRGRKQNQMKSQAEDARRCRSRSRQRQGYGGRGSRQHWQQWVVHKGVLATSTDEGKQVEEENEGDIGSEEDAVEKDNVETAKKRSREHRWWFFLYNVY